VLQVLFRNKWRKKNKAQLANAGISGKWLLNGVVGCGNTINVGYTVYEMYIVWQI